MNTVTMPTDLVLCRSKLISVNVSIDFRLTCVASLKGI
jgi:hypothetical protein